MELESLGKEPIAPDQPAGVDFRFDPLFEELQAEVGKLSSLSGPGSIDWGKVATLSTEILAGKSKDLLAASYLAVALIYQRKLEGLALGLKIYQDLLETFWDRLYPTKAKGRMNAVEWWVEKTEAALKQLEGQSTSREQFDLLYERMGKIETFFNEHLEEPPSLRPLFDQLDAFAPPPEKPQEKPQEPSPPKEERPPQPPRPEPETPTVLASAQDAQRLLQQAFQKIREAMNFLQQEDLSNPLPYRWSRILLWSNVEALPPATSGQTRIPPPPAQIKTLLSDLAGKGEHENLVRAAEARLPQFIFWLDLNRYVSEGLAHLGEKYAKAKEAVVGETAYLLHRLPGLETLTFSDGTPFADPATGQWIKEIALKRGGIAEALSPTSSSPSPSEGNLIEKEMEEAQAIIQKGRLLEGIERLQEKFYRSPSQRERLLWRLALVQTLLKNKQARFALPHLDQILREVDFYKLEEYDPELATRSLKVVWVGLSSQSDATSKERASEVLQRIAKLNLAEAIRLGKA
ncbi:MAG: type VI secretion system protein TssA [Desulfobacterota bacterium]|nr:type VI secretion system protein TssA [Thermodesulfobacteriota bacterium]